MKTITVNVNGTDLKFTSEPPKEVGYYITIRHEHDFLSVYGIETEKQLRIAQRVGGYWHRLIPEGEVRNLFKGAI